MPKALYCHNGHICNCLLGPVSVHHVGPEVEALDLQLLKTLLGKNFVNCNCINKVVFDGFLGDECSW